MTAGLYSRSAAETGGAGSLFPDLPSCCSLAAAAAARMPRPDEDPSAGSNEGSGGRLASYNLFPQNLDRIRVLILLFFVASSRAAVVRAIIM